MMELSVDFEINLQIPELRILLTAPTGPVHYSALCPDVSVESMVEVALTGRRTVMWRTTQAAGTCLCCWQSFLRSDARDSIAEH